MPPEKRKNPPTVSVEDVKPARLERYRDINCLEKQVSEEEILQYNIEDLKTLQIRMC